MPVLRDQITALIDNVPWLARRPAAATTPSRTSTSKYDVIDKAKEKLQNADLAQTAFGSVFTVGLAVLNALFNAFLIFVLTLYFLSALPSIKRSCTRWPRPRVGRASRYLGDEILRRVGGYVAGAVRGRDCAPASRRSSSSRSSGSAKYAVALALVVAILDFIPLIGATIGAVDRRA